MRTQNKGTRSSRFRITTIAIAVASSFAMTPAWAAPATNLPGNGVGIAIGSGSNAPKAENVAIGKGATIRYSGGVGQPSTGDIVIGGGAHTNNYIDQGGGIAIGSNSFVENMVGGLERTFDFNQAGYDKFLGVPYGFPKDPTKMVTGIAIGQNTYARSGSVMFGTHNYKGDLGDVAVDSASTKAQNMSLFSTTLGANSYSNGLFSTVTGAYSIASSDYSGGYNSVLKNFGATITGSLNSIESATASSTYSGVANSIVGTANRTFNSNGSLIFGAGNEITNSYASISGLPGGLLSSSPSSAKDLANTLRKSVKDSDGGGATLAIGGGNKADYTQRSQMIGVKNSITGTAGNVSTNNMVNGYANEASNVNNVSVIGSENSITNTNTAVVVGDKRTLTGADNSVIIGSSSNGTTTSVKNAVAIGAESNVTVEGGVALGADSIASTAAGIAGYDLSTGTTSTDTSATWKATAAAVSVGNAANNVTRQITGVAAGSVSANSTDAVNGGQLYQTNQAVQQNSDDISKLYNRSAELNRKIHRAGAHAAALAALHPLDFDENHRVSASLGLGQYHSSGAAALGIFVRPTENFMVSLGGSIASGSDVMGNLGVHYRFGGDSVRVNKTELTQQVSTLTAENRDLSAKLASSNSKLEAATSKIDSLMERIHAIEAKLNMK